MFLGYFSLLLLGKPLVASTQHTPQPFPIPKPSYPEILKFLFREGLISRLGMPRSCNIPKKGLDPDWFSKDNL
jgi:hypothetical protein